MRRLMSVLIFSFCLLLSYGTANAIDWYFDTTEIDVPSNFVADSTGSIFYASFNSSCGLWKSDDGEFTNLNSELLHLGQYTGGTIFHWNSSDSLIVLAETIPYGFLHDVLLYSNETHTWSNLGQFDDRYFKFYVDPDSTTIIVRSLDSLRVTNDLMETYQAQYFPDAHRIKEFLRIGDTHYIHMLYNTDSIVQTKIIPFIPGENLWDMDNPVFNTFGIYNSPTYLSCIKQMDNDEIFVSGYTSVDGSYQSFNRIYDLDWELILEIDDAEVHNKFFFQIVEDSQVTGKLFAHISTNGLHVSTDYGRTWEVLEMDEVENLYPNVTNIYRQPKNGYLYVSIEETGLFRSVDSGLSWEQLDLPDMIGNSKIAIHNNYFSITASGRKWYVHDDRYWQEYKIPNTSDTYYRHKDLYYVNGDTIFGDVEIFENLQPEPSLNLALSTDGGQNWSFTPIEYREAIEEMIAFPITNGVRLVDRYAYGDETYISYSENLGQNWTSFALPSMRFGQTEHYFYSSFETMSGDSLLVRKPVSGGEWEDLNFEPVEMSSFFFTPLENSVLVFCGIDPFIMGYDCYYLRDGQWLQGGHFSIYDTPDLVFEYDGQTVMLQCRNEYNGIWMSTDFGITCEYLNIEFPVDIPIQYFNYELFFNDHWNILYAVSDIGVFWCHVGDFVGVEEGIARMQPLDPKLFNSYPNPFNASTRIQYSLAEPGNVKLDVFDITGRLVKTLQNTYQSAGIQSVFFDGSGLASGSYFIRLQTGTEVRNRKITLIK